MTPFTRGSSRSVFMSDVAGMPRSRVNASRFSCERLYAETMRILEEEAAARASTRAQRPRPTMATSMGLSGMPTGYHRPTTRRNAMRRRFLAALAGAAALAWFHSAVAAEADDYPKRPVKIIVPQSAGSSNDTLTRILAVYLGEELGQNVVIENQAAASGLLGMEMGKNAAPDGYTLIAGSPSGTTIAASLRTNL